MTKFLTRIALLATLFLSSFAITLYASNVVDCSVTPSDPSCAPTLVLTYKVGNGQLQNLPDGGTATYIDGAWHTDFVPQVFPEFLFTGGQLVTTPDPFVGFSFGVINNSHALMTFNYDFTAPYAGGPYLLAQSIFGDVLIDTNFAGNSTVAPVGSRFIMNTYDTGLLLNFLGIGMGCTTPNLVYVCTSPDIGAIGPLAYLSNAAGSLEVKGSFTLTPGGQYTLTGRSQIFVPEPGTLALLGTGILGLGGWIRRRL